MKDLLEKLGGSLREVHLTELRDGVFYSDLVLKNTANVDVTMSARPSDAIALALRTKSAIFATEELLTQAGIEMPEEDSSQANEEVERFREFLDQINPEDFAS
jgi:bifunctional DNase/RNase